MHYGAIHDLFCGLLSLLVWPEARPGLCLQQFPPETAEQALTEDKRLSLSSAAGLGCVWEKVCMC